MATKSYGCEVRNEPNLAQKRSKNSHFSTSSDFLENCPYHSNDFFYSHSTPYYGPLCAISLISDGWDLRNMAKINPKMAKKQTIFDFFRFSQKLFKPLERIFLQTFYAIYESICSMASKSHGSEVRNKPNLAQKWLKNSHFSTFSDFLKNCPNDSNEFFSGSPHLIMVLYVPFH